MQKVEELKRLLTICLRELHKHSGEYDLEIGINAANTALEILGNSESTEPTENIKDIIAEIDPEAVMAEGWDDCILGTAFCPGRKLLVVYDGDAIVRKLATEMAPQEATATSEEEALELAIGTAEEYFSFNIEGAWVGDRTPVFVRKIIAL